MLQGRQRAARTSGRGVLGRGKEGGRAGFMATLESFVFRLSVMFYGSFYY